MKFLKKNLEKILLIVFFGALLTLILFTYKDFGVAWDEKFYLDVGRYYGTLILNFFHIQSNLGPPQFQPSYFLLHIKGHGVFFDVIGFFLSTFFNKFTFESYHLLKAILAIPIFIFLYLSLKKLLNWKMALSGIVMLLLSPYFYGNMYVNSIDIPTVLAFAGTFYYFIEVFLGKRSISNQILLSFFLALLVTQRIIFLYAFGLIILFIFVEELRNRKLFSGFKKGLFISTLTLVFMHLFHPYLMAHPIKGIFDMLTSAESYPWTAAILFEGNLIYPKDIAWYYLPKTMLITTPEVVIALFILGNYYLFSRLISRLEKVIKKFFYAFILVLFYLPIILTIILKPTIYDSWRHFLFLTIPLIVISIYGLNFTMQLKLKRFKMIIILILVVAAANIVLTMRYLHPYEYVYYNSLTGGLKGAYRQYETDYWGEGFKEAVFWFNKNINKPNKDYVIKFEGDYFSSVPYFKENMTPTYDREKADYVFTFTRWDLDRTYPGKTIYEITRSEVPLIMIKEGAALK